MYRSLSVIVLYLAALPLVAQPLSVVNQSPFAAMMGLAPALSAQLGDPGEFSLRTNTIISSHFLDQSTSAESLIFDGESVALDVAASYVIKDGWRLDIGLPYRRHSGGKLDALIDGWHSTFGLPDGGRDQVARDQLHYAYQQDGKLRASLADSNSGFGNVQFGISHRIWRRDEQQASVRLVYSGNRGEDFISADSSAWSASINYSHLEFLGRVPIDLRLGWLNTAKIRAIGSQKGDILFTTLATQWQFAEHTALKFQLDAHGAIADSSLDALARNAVMLSVGLSRKIAPKWTIELAVTEDIAVETAADVSFLLSVKYEAK